MSANQPVALVIHRRIADEGFGEFSRWQTRVATRLQSWPGFVSQQVVPPAPPEQVDWTIVQRFTSAEAAQSWLASDDHHRLIDEISRYFVGLGELHLMPDAGTVPKSAVSALISFAVKPEDEPAFLKWQNRLQAAQAKSPGFQRHKLERPVPGIHDDWLVIVSFDTEAHLTTWIDSAERHALLEEGRRFGDTINVRRSNYGFDFWFPPQSAAPADKHRLFKSNLLILVVLYPVVFLWTFLISAPLIDSRGTPFWASLLIGNVVSTQLLGWWFAPMIFRLFAWWLAPTADLRRTLAGYAAVAAMIAVGAAVCALLAKVRL